VAIRYIAFALAKVASFGGALHRQRALPRKLPQAISAK